MSLEDKLLQQMEYEKPYITELFGPDKYFNGPLTPDERKLLEEYIHDKNNPQWKDIILPNKDIRYEVSNIGQVRNKETGHIKADNLVNGYYNTILYFIDKNTRIKSIYVSSKHRLVAKYFVSNDDPEYKTQVDHINGIKTCNWYKNLEWVTPKENKRRAIVLGLDNPHHGNQAKGSKSGMSTHTEEDAQKVCELLEKGLSNKEISLLTNFNIEFIRSIRRGATWKHISEKYNIPGPEKRNYYANTIRENIRNLIDLGFNDMDIALKLNLNDPGKYGRKYVNKIRSRYNKV